MMATLEQLQYEQDERDRGGRLWWMDVPTPPRPEGEGWIYDWAHWLRRVGLLRARNRYGIRLVHVYTTETGQARCYLDIHREIETYPTVPWMPLEGTIEAVVAMMRRRWSVVEEISDAFV